MDLAALLEDTPDTIIEAALDDSEAPAMSDTDRTIEEARDRAHLLLDYADRGGSTLTPSELRDIAGTVGDLIDEIKRRRRTEVHDPLGETIVAKCVDVRDLLLEKNAKYGNSALEPLGVFGADDVEAGLRERIDDKLKRIQRGAADDDEDPLFDLIGYLILLLIHRDRDT
jgi:hypothetical protein